MLIISNKDMVELFGTEANKERYYRTKKVDNSMKETLISNAKKEYKTVEDLGRGRYKIEDKINNVLIPNNKINHPIFGSLLPAILLNVKEYHDFGKVFCLSLNSIYYNFNMINKNYIDGNNRKNTTSKILNVDLNTCYEFFDTTHIQLKYYLVNSLNVLSSLKLIEYITVPYISLVNKEIDTNIVKGMNDKVYITRRRATAEEIQSIRDINSDIRKKYDISMNSKLFGEPLKEYLEKLKQINIEYEYNCYEIICINKKEIEKTLEFYNTTNKKELSDKFTDSFISLVTKNAKSRHLKAIENNMKDFHRFNKKYLDDFLTLSNNTLDYKKEPINIPKYKVDYQEDTFGGIKIKTTETN